MARFAFWLVSASLIGFTPAMWSTVSGWFSGKSSDVCQREFPQVYSGFIDYLIDTLHAQGHTPRQLSQMTPQEAPPLRLPAAKRVIAIGDLHGDYEKTLRAFRIAGLIDEHGRWSGGQTTAVQVGDQLDRGDDEVRILYFLERLQLEATESGGALHILTGNHETMNVAGRFRYTTPGGTENFAAYTLLHSMASAMKASCGCSNGISEPLALSGLNQMQSRYAAVSPGGPVAVRFLAPHPVVLQIGSTVFVHGGLLPQHIEYGLERINSETKAWMLGRGGREMPAFLGGRDAVVWARDYSQDERRCNCKLLEESLRMVPGAKRMVVGHTIQGSGINAACDNQVYRVDVGLSQGCGDGEPEVLEIVDDKLIRSLREGKQPVVFTTEPDVVASPAPWSLWRKEREAVAAAPS